MSLLLIFIDFKMAKVWKEFDKANLWILQNLSIPHNHLEMPTNTKYIQSVTGQQVDGSQNNDHHYDSHQNIRRRWLSFFLPLGHERVLIYNPDLELRHDSVDGVLGVDCLVEGDCRTTAGLLCQDDGASRMLSLVLGNIIYVVMNNDP